MQRDVLGSYLREVAEHDREVPWFWQVAGGQLVVGVLLVLVGYVASMLLR